MECGYRNQRKFHQVVLNIKEKIEKHDLSKWKNIVKPEEGAKYNEYFEQLLRGDHDGNDNKDAHNNDECGKELNVASTSDNNEKRMEEKNNTKFELNKEFFDHINNKEKFYFLLNIKEMMETSWLLSRKRLEGIKLEEKSKPVNVQELINYSKKIADTTCAPPECDNINDKIMHQEYYPNYHFLNFVNVEEIHLSKLFQLQKYSTVCFPPIITIQEDVDNLLVVNITCSTPHVIIYYRVNDAVNEQIYNADEKPKIVKRKKINVYARSVREGYMKSRISCISKSYKVEDDTSSVQETVLSKKLEEQSLDTLKTDNDANVAHKSSQMTNVFKNLGFLLSRKREKTEMLSSNDESSSDGSK
ncbi:hypothetical protein, conserved [Plasmodium gonderi]|uniref:Mediator of RNA polymerase II transcription subunit 4 n=1 Tax=Plasmodium gonderi TaxID=77519 RepID=A0A1Y1JPT3_PLAGO|nr:hypothetical protein, conserved [Plasmodium gonderi]GAW82433.1 hypothetical protein, conserved [Plasmodium gonderi]